MAAASLVLLSWRPVRADYATVTGDVVAWEWARAVSPGDQQITDIAVREDGWMIVSTAAFVDGHLYVIPPWGGTLAAGNRLGRTAFGFRQIELRGGRLFGLRQNPQHDERQTHNPARLVEVDPATGEPVREHGDWWYQDLAVDPRTSDLVLQGWGGAGHPYRHDLVRYDPDSGAQQVLVADEDPRADTPFEVAFNDDGSRLYTADVGAVPVTIDVRDRAGRVLHTLQSGQIDALTVGRSGTCFEDLLLITRSDGSAWTLPVTPNSVPAVLAAGGRPGVVSYATLDRDGHLLTARYADATLLACAPFTPPQPPRATPAATPPPPVAALAQPTPAGPPPEVSGGAASPVNAAPPASGPATPPVPPAPPSPPAPAPVAPPSALGAAAQSAAAPVAGMADSPDEEHITSVAASSMTPYAYSVGVTLVLALAAYAWAGPTPGARVRPARGDQ